MGCSLARCAPLTIDAGEPETPESVWDEVLRVNLMGVFLCCRAAIPAMLQSGGGSIVNLSSIGALRGTTYSVPYAAAKAGVIQLTRSVAAQYGSLGIRANCIVPGPVDTPMSRETTAASRNSPGGPRRSRSGVPASRRKSRRSRSTLHRLKRHSSTAPPS